MTNSAVIALPAICDLGAAAPLKDALTALLNGADRLTIDAGAVRQFGTPCAQVLLSAERSTQGGVQISEASPVFIDAMRDLGLDAALERWSKP
ncbi:MAG: STAS domain-containing protein [Pseudomonadota bacterium]